LFKHACSILDFELVEWHLLDVWYCLFSHIPNRDTQLPWPPLNFPLFARHEEQYFLNPAKFLVYVGDFQLYVPTS
jgi:hypothetical protein